LTIPKNKPVDSCFIAFNFVLNLLKILKIIFMGGVRVLERNYTKTGGLVYIGKKANNIEDQPLDGTGTQVFIK
jgi:hypothetical protein